MADPNRCSPTAIKHLLGGFFDVRVVRSTVVDGILLDLRRLRETEKHGMHGSAEDWAELSDSVHNLRTPHSKAVNSCHVATSLRENCQERDVLTCLLL
jgi:hypothetical protein